MIFSKEDDVEIQVEVQRMDHRPDVQVWHDGIAVAEHLSRYFGDRKRMRGVASVPQAFRFWKELSFQDALR